ncbi:MAG: hypothetical protein PUH44_00370 [Bacteroidales bacterium]|nr:RICIN domain-containing protein [Bacteroidales bacterium]MDD7232113.1 hypothetical protein [Bacteroidales bacterium]MDY2704977.1 hypothetical protein [Alloprevotella sp.]
MRKISSILTLLLLCLCGNLSAQTVIARMATLADAATNSDKATVSTDWETSAEGGAVYEFSNSKYLGAISNNAVVEAIEGNKYVTVAMWVYGPTTSDQALFGYGDQNTGVKVSLNGNAQKMTTKGVADFDITTVNANNIQANQWCFVAFSFRGAAYTSDGTTYRYYTSTTNGQYSSKSNKKLSGMNAVADASKLLAIGSGNQGNARDVYTGLIANLTVITSDELLNNSALADLVGAAPTPTISGLRNLITTRINHINENKGEGIGYYSTITADAAIATAQTVVNNQSSTSDELQAQLDALNALSINLPQSGKTYRIVSAYPNFEAQQDVKKAMYAGTETTTGNNPVTASIVRWGNATYTNNAYFWTIVPNGNGGYTIKNEETGKYMGAWGSPIGNRQILSDTPNSITLTWLGQGQFNIKNGSNALHTQGHNSGAGVSDLIVGWNGGLNSCSAWYIEEETLCAPADITYRLMDGGDVLWSTTIAAAVGKPYPKVTGFYNKFATFTVPAGPVTQTETVDLAAPAFNPPFPYGASVETAPTVALDVHGNEAKYPLYNNSGNLRVEYKEYTNAPDYTQGATKNNTYFWKIVGDAAHGFKIYNVSAEKYIHQTSDGDVEVTLDAEGTTFQVYNTTSGINNSFSFKVPSRSNYINHRGTKLQGWTAADAGSSFRAYPITEANASYDLTLTGQYATLCVPFYAEVPAGITLYSNSSVDGNGVLELTEITSPEFIMPGKPYIVEAAAGTYNLSNTSILTSKATTNEGYLYGVLADDGETVPNGSYVLARNKNTNKQGFFRTNGTVNCPQYKCYLTLPATSPTAAKELYFDNEGTTTGIEAIFGGENEEVVIYDLSGKRLSRLQKGVNIVNGHKVIVK